MGIRYSRTRWLPVRKLRSVSMVPPAKMLVTRLEDLLIVREAGAMTTGGRYELAGLRRPAQNKYGVKKAFQSITFPAAGKPAAYALCAWTYYTQLRQPRQGDRF